MTAAWPFTGRDGDLARATTALADRGAVVLVGPAGVGKSRLARELLDRLGPRRVLGVVRATVSAREIPLGCLLGLLPAVPAGEVAPDLSHFHLAVEALGPRDGRDVLLVDDAHLLDALSATAIHRLAVRGVRLVVTLRAGESAPEAVTALWKDEPDRRVEVGPLDRDRTLAALTGALGGPLEPVTARRLHESSGGNLLWLRHLVDGEVAAGRLRQEAGRWAWSGDVALSPVLTDLVAARIGGLDEARRHVLGLLAVAEPLDLDLLEEVVGAEPVEEVAQRELVAIAADGDGWEVRLAHPLYGEAVRGAAGEPGMRRLRAELADAIGCARSPRPDDDLRRALLVLDSGHPPDPALLLIAARQASGLTDLTLAERLLRAAVDAGGGFEARAGLAALLVYLLRAGEADEVLREATDAATDPADVTRAVLVRTLIAHFGASGDDVGDGEAVLRDEERRVGSREEEPRFDAVRCLIQVCRNRAAEGVARGERVLADPASTDDDIALASWGVGYARAFSGLGGPLRDVVARGVEATTRSPVTVNYAANIAFGEILDAHVRGDPVLARDRLAWARGLPGAQGALWVALFEGRLATTEGRPRTAIPLLEGVLTVFPGHGGGWSGWLLATIAQCHAVLGEPVAARDALTAAEDRWHPLLTIPCFELDLARAWVAAASGDGRAALERAHEGARRCRSDGLPAAEVLLRQTAVRLGDPEQAGRLADLDRALGTPRSALAAGHAAAFADADPERLLGVSARLEEAGLRLEAADASAQAATAARAAGRLVLAAEAEQRARALAAAGEGARTPALVGAEVPVALSAREREVARLAGEGLTNRQIAERLQVSVRTVESHVYRACSRLGLSDRAALVAVAGVSHVQ